MLQVGGRYSDEQELSCELTIDRGYVLHGTSEAMSRAEAEKVVANLPASGVTLKQLQEEHPSLSRSTLQRAIENAERQRAIYRTGTGSRRSPFVYFGS